VGHHRAAYASGIARRKKLKLEHAPFEGADYHPIYDGGNECDGYADGKDDAE
jgi:hypothetical protein